MLLERTEKRPFLDACVYFRCVKKEPLRFCLARFLITSTLLDSDDTLKMYSNNLAGSCFVCLSEDISGLLDEASP